MLRIPQYLDRVSLDKGRAVSTSSSAKRGQFWRTDWFVAVLVVLVVLILHQATDAIGTLERRFYDFGSTSSGRQPSDRIAVIAIDDQSIANIGRWPWPRDVHAQLIDQLAGAKAKTIVYTTFFFEPQTDRGLVFIRKIKETLGPVAEGAGGQAEQLAKVIAEAETDAGHRRQAGRQHGQGGQRAGAVRLPSSASRRATPTSRCPRTWPGARSTKAAGFSVPAVRGQYPIELIGNAAAGIGHLNQLSDVDGAVRDDPLLVNYYGKAVPSMALLAAAKSLNLGPRDIKLNAGDSVQIGKLRVKTDDIAPHAAAVLQGQRDGKPAFAVDSFYDVLSGKIPAGKYTDKIVLIGATAAGWAPPSRRRAIPGSSPAEMMAHITSSILGEHFIVQPGVGELGRAGGIPAGGRLPDRAAAAAVGGHGRQRSPRRCSSCCSAASSFCCRALRCG